MFEQLSLINSPISAKSQCENEREKAITYNYRNTEKITGPLFVPDCQPNGNYYKVQWRMVDGVSWCVDEFTGNEIEGTRTTGHGDHLPVCPGIMMTSIFDQPYLHEILASYRYWYPKRRGGT